MASKKSKGRDDQPRIRLTAHQTFIVNRTTAINRLREIRETIDLLSATEKTDKKNWGFAGSMGHAVEELDALLAFFNGDAN